jgi:hypothetical protein
MIAETTALLAVNFVSAYHVMWARRLWRREEDGLWRIAWMLPVQLLSLTLQTVAILPTVPRAMAAIFAGHAFVYALKLLAVANSTPEWAVDLERDTTLASAWRLFHRIHWFVVWRPVTSGPWPGARSGSRAALQSAVVGAVNGLLYVIYLRSLIDLVARAVPSACDGDDGGCEGGAEVLARAQQVMEVHMERWERKAHGCWSFGCPPVELRGADGGFIWFPYGALSAVSELIGGEPLGIWERMRRGWTSGACEVWIRSPIVYMALMHSMVAVEETIGAVLMLVADAAVQPSFAQSPVHLVATGSKFWTRGWHSAAGTGLRDGVQKVLRGRLGWSHGAATLATFAVSGVCHEWVAYASQGVVPGTQLLFFLAAGGCTLAAQALGGGAAGGVFSIGSVFMLAPVFTDILQKSFALESLAVDTWNAMVSVLGPRVVHVVSPHALWSAVFPPFNAAIACGHVPPLIAA